VLQQVDLLDGRLAGRRGGVLVSGGIAGGLVGQQDLCGGMSVRCWCSGGTCAAWRWWGGVCGGMQGPAVRVSEEAGRVVVPRNLCGVFSLRGGVAGVVLLWLELLVFSDC
jgi:hypothetical protein